MCKSIKRVAVLCLTTLVPQFHCLLDRAADRELAGVICGQELSSPLLKDESDQDSVIGRPPPQSFTVTKDSALDRLSIASRRLQTGYVDLSCNLSSYKRIVERKNPSRRNIFSGYELMLASIAEMTSLLEVEGRMVALCVTLLRRPDGEPIPRKELDQIKTAKANFAALEMVIESSSTYLAVVYAKFIKPASPARPDPADEGDDGLTVEDYVEEE